MPARSSTTRLVLILGAIVLLAAGAWLIGRGLRPANPPTGGSPPPAADELRFVVLSPGIAVMLRDIGLADRIVGRHAYDLVLPRDIPVCGDQVGIDYETVLRVRPTHILAEESAKGLPDRLTALAEAEGWRIRVFPLLKLDDIQRCVSELHTSFVLLPRQRAEGTDPGVLAGEAVVPSRSDAENRLVESLRFRGPALAGAGRVLLLGAVNPPAVLGPGSWHHQILERIGGVPAVTEGQPFMSLDAEDVLRLAPDAIILILPREPAAPASAPSAEQVRSMLGRVGDLDIPAVRAGRLALIDDPLAHTPSTAMADLADHVARLLESWSR